MSTELRTHDKSSASEWVGTAGLVLGILFVLAVAVTYVLSLTDLVDPPNWVRAMALVWLPIGFVGVPMAWLVAGNGPGRNRAVTGVVIALAGAVAFVALVVVMG
jgi:hypothetical protein